MHYLRHFPMFSLVYDKPSGLSRQDVQDMLPKPADNTPKPEARNASPGAVQARYALEDHQHQRLTSATTHVLDANGYATVTFTRVFEAEPAISFASLGMVGGPVPDFTGDFIRADNVNKTGDYVGLQVYGERKKALPLLTGVVLLGPLVGYLTGYKPWEPAAGAKVAVIAVANSAT